MADEGERRWVVVGIDGSARDRVAVDWGVVVARGRRVGVRLLAGWSNEPDYREDFQQHSGEWLAAAETVVREVDPSLAVDIQACDQPAVEALLAASEGAELIVVGDGGHPHQKWHEVIDGSVGHKVTAHAKCPVLVAKQEP